MKAKYSATIKDEKIVEWSESTPAMELTEHQIPLTENEHALIDACRGDLELAKDIIRDIEARKRGR